MYRIIKYQYSIVIVNTCKFLYQLTPSKPRFNYNYNECHQNKYLLLELIDDSAGQYIGRFYTNHDIYTIEQLELIEKYIFKGMVYCNKHHLTFIGLFQIVLTGETPFLKILSGRGWYCNRNDLYKYDIFSIPEQTLSDGVHVTFKNGNTHDGDMFFYHNRLNFDIGVSGGSLVVK